MKVFTTLFILLLLISSCKEESSEVAVMDSYEITGTAAGVPNGIRAYLKTTDERGSLVDVDTAIVRNEKFTFSGKVEKPERIRLFVNSVNGSVPFILENAAYEINVNTDKIDDSEITGTPSTDAMQEFNKNIAEMSTEGRNLNSQYRLANKDNDNETLDKVAKELQIFNDKQAKYPYEFVRKNNDNAFSLNLLEDLMRVKDADVAELESSYNALSSRLKDSEYGKAIGANLEALKKQREALAFLDVGKTPPNFTAPNPEGKMVSLDDIKGKATIIDFWAAWCGPCRRENPNVVRVYEKFHDKGLEIIGVSLDGSSRQQDPKAAWLKAIEDDNLNWNHVSNLKYFNDPVAQLYNIRSIPATYILDADGKIAAKNLRGLALEQKIAEMLAE